MMSLYQKIQVIRNGENEVVAVAVTSLEPRKRLPNGRYIQPFESGDPPGAEVVFQPRVSVYYSMRVREYLRAKYPTPKSLSENMSDFLRDLGVEFQNGPDRIEIPFMPPNGVYIKEPALAYVGPLTDRVEYYETRSRIADIG
jgi:hypothetical protein